MATLATIITGTILATGKTFSHSLGTTPDIIIVIPENNTATQQFNVLTFNSNNFTVQGALDALAFRALVIKLHSIIS